MDKHTRLVFKAVKQNDFNKVKTLLDKSSSDLNCIDFSGDCPLSTAVAYNNEEMVKYLVEKGASVNNNKTSRSPLIVAIDYDFLEMAKLLIDLGANVNEALKGGHEVFPLVIATTALKYEMTKLLILKGANVHVDHPFRSSFLHSIGFYKTYNFPHLITNRLKIAKLFLKNNLDVNAKNDLSLTPLFMLNNNLSSSFNGELVKLFIKEGAKVRLQLDDQNILDQLFYAVGSYDPEIVRLCLEHGSDFLNFIKVNNKYIFVYHWALKEAKPDVVKVFWAFGCPVDLPAPEAYPGIKPTEVADLQLPSFILDCLQIQFDLIGGIAANNLSQVLTAIKNGAEPKGTSVKIPSPLHHLAANGGRRKIARVLLEHGVPVNKLDSAEKKTCLSVAISTGNLHVMKEILMFGGSFARKDLKSLPSEKSRTFQDIHSVLQEIMTAFQLTKRGNSKVLKQLKRLLNTNKEMVKVLMNCVDWKGRSLLDLALSKGHYELADELMKLRIEYL